MSDALRRYTDRCSSDPAFFGHALRAYATRRLWTNARLAAWLGCDLATLDGLRRSGCVRPEHREADLLDLSTASGVSVEKLRPVCDG